MESSIGGLEEWRIVAVWCDLVQAVVRFHHGKLWSSDMEPGGVSEGFRRNVHTYRHGEAG